MATGATALLLAWLDVALDLAKALVAGPFFLSIGIGIDSFFLASATYLPFFEGEMLGVSSWGVSHR